MLARRVAIAFVFLLGAPLVLSLSSSSTLAAGTPRVLAFYYAWYDANTWNRNLVSDLPSQPYASSDPTAIARHIQQAQGAGIDAFVVSWLGPNNPTDTNFKTMLGLAQNTGFAATIDFEAEQYGSRDAVVNALTYVRDNLMNQPAFLRGQAGKPILFFWREQNFSVSDWGTIRDAVDPNHQQIWIAEGVDLSYQQVFDGHHLYSIAWSPDINYTLSSWANRVRGADKIWVATVMPGYDDTRTSRPDRFSRARDDGDFYRTTWQAALNTNPDFIIIDSFNEWVEGSMIEPSVTYGNLYLDITRQFAAQFKSAAPVQTSLLTSAPQATPLLPTLAPNQRVTTDILRVRSGPGLDQDIIGRLPANTVINVLARSTDNQWLQIAYPRGDNRGWVAAEYTAPQTGMDSFPIVGFPTSTPSIAPNPILMETQAAEATPSGDSDAIPYDPLPLW